MGRKYKSGHAKVEVMVEMVLEKDLIDYPALKLHVYL